MVGLHDMLQQWGLLAVAAQEEAEAEAAGGTEGKRPRVGPYGAPTKPPRKKVALANPALVNKLAASVAYIQKHMPSPGDEKEKEEDKKGGDGLSQEETQVASASEVAQQLASQAQGRGRTENTVLDAPSLPPSQGADAQMQDVPPYAPPPREECFACFS